MPKEDTEPYSNPLPPPDYNHDVGDDAHPLTNEDFRKLLMTPRVAIGSSSGSHSSLSASATSGGTSGGHAAGSHELGSSAVGHGSVSERGGLGSSGAAGASGAGGGAGLSLGDLTGSGGGSGAGAHGGDESSSVGARLIGSLDDDEPDVGDRDDDDPATRRRKKKSYYARLKRMEEDRQKELAQKYRDRAKERRDGLNRDYAETEIISTTADYRAVAPDAKSGENYAERRKQIIQESKYLGGDMEHTHLVKGLDYALLEKSKYPERNELFLPSRMAYVVDLEDEFAESDVPTTLIRSKADCPAPESDTTLTTNDIVINKLTQILSYLRQGRPGSGGTGVNSGEKTLLPGHDESIYGDVGEYVPSMSSSNSKTKRDRKDRDRDRDRSDRDRDRDRNLGSSGDRDRDRGRDYYDRSDRERTSGDRRDRDRDRNDRADRDRSSAMVSSMSMGSAAGSTNSSSKKTYFEKPADEDEEKDRMPNSAKELVKSINECFKSYAEIEEEKEKAANKKEEERLRKLKAKMEIDSYAECYPGMMESADAIDDSDDEVDYTKMDHGNKKGPIGRWDFDSQEEYSEYMANKEAMPKAAFQYGVKMADGRKTRRTGPKDEKAELDRQWQKIQRIIEKRKNTDDNFEYKRVKY
ncbi:IK [Acanthosepion pharaonis]|uniref:IK n=1 Tax=Acanthosepion pharaonis TaxID=158019 RepID=A0A812EC72_ACAPH|nr:IK [Sepia pharaonis]